MLILLTINYINIITYKSCCHKLLWKNEETCKTFANRCKKLQRNEKRMNNERRFDVALGYSITVRDVITCHLCPLVSTFFNDLAVIYGELIPVPLGLALSSFDVHNDGGHTSEKGNGVIIAVLDTIKKWGNNFLDLDLIVFLKSSAS